MIFQFSRRNAHQACIPRTSPLKPREHSPRPFTVDIEKLFFVGYVYKDYTQFARVRTFCACFDAVEFVEARHTDQTPFSSPDKMHKNSRLLRINLLNTNLERTTARAGACSLWKLLLCFALNEMFVTLHSINHPILLRGNSLSVYLPLR